MPRQKLFAVIGNERMENLLQDTSIFRILKHTLPQTITVDSPISTQNIIAKRCTNLGHRHPPNPKKVMHTLICIEHGNATLTKHICGRGFSRGYSTSQANHNHSCPRNANP
jgi:hypothetical protein